MIKTLIMLLVKLRWAYFHIHPHYVKFWMDSERTEAHFQNVKDGSIHSNYVWIDEPPT